MVCNGSELDDIRIRRQWPSAIGAVKAGIILVSSLGITSPAWAIPSPDLLINLSASAAQVLGLLSVIVCGFAYLDRKKTDYRMERRKTWRWISRITLACLLISIGLNIFQYTAKIDEKNRRLQTNLIRSSVENGKSVRDVSLKTLSFSEQLKHPRGIHTEKLARWLEEGRPLNIIDIREPEEVEMGRIKGAWHRRYPDLRQNPEGFIKEKSETVLLCFSGNRSSELCDEFTREGYACRFMIGGYEKWIAEGRPLELADSRTAEEIRELPYYPNKSTLLDTQEVMALVEKENAVFVDVRSPGDFEAAHLPGAINIPIRKLTSEELRSQLESIPHRPVIAPCYDKRSSFYSHILGLRLHRLGYDFQGRYSVPHEFFMPHPEKPYVARWKADREEITLLGMASVPLKAAMECLSERSGHLAGGILLMVLSLRLLFSPVAFKAERDQLVQRKLAPEVKALKEKFKNDAQRASRAIMHIYRRERLTPARNLIATIAQVLLFFLLFSVVDSFSKSVSEGFLWIPDLGKPDPTYLLPNLVGILLFAYLALTASRRTHLHMLLYFLLGAVVSGMIYRLSAGVSLYLLISVCFIFLQSGLVRLLLQRSQAAAKDNTRVMKLKPQEEDPGIILLKSAHRIYGTGNKAIRLAQMIEAGLPVPDGFAITSKILDRESAEGADGAITLYSEEEAHIRKLWHKLDLTRVAVRSSGLNEDGSAQSYAGVFESKLNVTWDEFLPSLVEVRQSLRSCRASAYGGNTNEPGGIVVQRMVEAEYAGVLFTEHPASAGCMLVELVSGLGETLVSGNATPEAYRFGTVSGSRRDPKKPPIDLAPLLALGKRVEALFGKPQDIEWAYSRGRFLLLQARDITVSVCEGTEALNIRERERRRLLELAQGTAFDEAVFVQNELSELLPRPTPLSHSLMERLWNSGGSVDLACRNLGIPYDVNEFSAPYIVTAFGSLFVNRREGECRNRGGSGVMAAFRLARSAEHMEEAFREDFLPGFQREMRIREALDLARIDRNELLSLFETWTDEFITKFYVEAEIINVAAEFYWKTATHKLKRHNLDPAQYLGNINKTVVNQATSLLVDIRKGKSDINEFMQLFGHRAPNDYELSQARYREDVHLVRELVSRAQKAAGENGTDVELPKKPVIALAVRRARVFQVLKEEAKHHCLKQLAALRRLLLEIDERFGLEGGVFQLKLDEIVRLRDPGFRKQAGKLIAQRRRDAEAWDTIRLPSKLSIETLESIDLEGTGSLVAEMDGVLQGTRVAGQGEVVGPVQVIHEPEDIDSFREGQILVARFTDPTWTPLFSLAKGLVTEVGGWLSHAAIVAREYNLTTIVGAAGSSTAFETGQLVRLRNDGVIEKFENRRMHDRIESSSRLLLMRDGEKTEAVLCDLSKSGARISVDAELSTGEQLVVNISNIDGDLKARVIRRTPQGNYGLRFLEPLGEIPDKE